MLNARNLIKNARFLFLGRLARQIGRVNRFARLAAAALVVGTALGGTAVTAHAVTVKVDRVTAGFEADFGSGFHFHHFPDNGTVTWDYTTNSNNLVNVTARVSGTLYVDTLRAGGGRAFLRIKFLDQNRNELRVKTLSVCGPGGNANLDVNQLTIDETFADVRLREVQLWTGFNSCHGGFMTGGEAGFEESVAAPLIITKYCKIDGGKSDFGTGWHLFGAPTGDGKITFTLQPDGMLNANVNGILYYDDWDGGTARLIIDFLSANGTVLRTRIVDEAGGWSHNATESSNQEPLSRNFTSGQVQKVRLTTAVASGSGFVNTATKTISIAQ